MLIVHYKVLAAQTLVGGGAAVKSRGVPCRGATLVTARIKATNTVAPSAFSWQLADDVNGWVGSADAYANDNAGEAIAGQDLSFVTTGTVPVGRTASLSGPSGTNMFAPAAISFQYARVLITPNATPTSDTTGCEIDMWVHYDTEPNAREDSEVGMPQSVVGV